MRGVRHHHQFGVGKQGRRLADRGRADQPVLLGADDQDRQGDPAELLRGEGGGTRAEGGTHPAEARRPDIVAGLDAPPVELVLVAFARMGEIAVPAPARDQHCGRRLPHRHVAEAQPVHRVGDVRSDPDRDRRAVHLEHRRGQDDGVERGRAVDDRPEQQMAAHRMAERDMRPGAGRPPVVDLCNEIVDQHVEARHRLLLARPARAALPPPVEGGDGPALGLETGIGLQILLDEVAAAVHEQQAAAPLAARGRGPIQAPKLHPVGRGPLRKDGAFWVNAPG